MLFVKNKFPKKVYFVVPNKRWGTYFLRGVQVQKMLSKHGINAKITLSKNIHTIKNSIVVFVKHISFDECLIAKNNGNIVIYDILDGYEQDLSFIKDEQCVDGLIYSTKASMPLIPTRKNMFSTLIYHHIDPRVMRTFNKQKQISAFKMCYIGNSPENTNNVSYLESIPDITFIYTDTRHAERNRWMHQISPFTSHYAVRIDPMQCKTKPLAKIGVAAACNANIIINRSNAASELLGDDYPFYTENSKQSVLETIEFAKENYGNSIWKQSLDRMEELKKQLVLETVVHQYIDFFQNWE